MTGRIWLVACTAVVLACATFAVSSHAQPSDKTRLTFAQAVKHARQHMQRGEVDAARPHPQTGLIAHPLPDTSISTVLWAFPPDHPRWPGQRFLLSSTDERCYTEIPQSSPALCINVGQEGMRRIIALHAWVAGNQQEASARRDAARKPQDATACKAWYEALPEQYRLIRVDLANSIKLKALGFQIEGDDDSGGGFNYLAEVAINEPQRPVVLVVQSYYPTVWKISYAPGTRIAAVWATGYHSQWPIGLPEGVPLLRTFYAKPACPGHRSGASPTLPHKPERYTIVDDQRLQIGASASWIDTGNVRAMRKKNGLNGTDGLKELQQQGILRPLTRKEWMAVNAKRGKRLASNNLSDDHPVAGHYVILKPMTFPTGLYGAYSASFHLPDGVPLPRGDLGHSTITISNGYCLGCSY